ncbi:tRNA(Met) cytidine acetyltransferase [Thalassotalea euphylliae]|uniref:tRNA(Met) cytidine acetyltransferase TmcA n=1 Tax=Thalassotalea euphylliae TaxID=1655234 RepID=A0A3E0TMD0_9GAMM|nr:GNAT family N-acetyltransferase [Thalassotalea euphylliae]REL25719.1 tRNA(Met) cytidine acetyltransferase [Thalassotalea euphylliae]
MAPSPIAHAATTPGFQAYKQHLNANRHRGAIFLSGSLTWAIEWFLAHEVHSFAHQMGLLSGVMFSDQFAELVSDLGKANVSEGGQGSEEAKSNNREILCDSVEQGEHLASRDHLSQLKRVNSKTYRHHLGTENNLVFFADPQLNLDALAALSGTICAGGILYVWLGDGASKQAAGNQAATNNVSSTFIASHFVERLCLAAQRQPFIQLVQQNFVQQNNESSQLFAHDGYGNRQHSADTKMSSDQFGHDTLGERKFSEAKAVKPQVTTGQQAVIAHITRMLSKGRNKPLILTADRGRGKSTALAWASAELLQKAIRPLTIAITAPHSMALGVFFSQLGRTLPDGQLSQHCFSWQQHQIIFVPVDELLRAKPQADLLLVDEAAGVPVYLLEKLVKQYSRLVFASTIHGYEGAGKGFTGKFLPLLKAQGVAAQIMELNEPIRWAANDPLEQLMFDACLLNAHLPTLPTDLSRRLTSHPELIGYQCFSGQELAADEQMLEQIFAILVTAHYQTKPSDLKLLLDDPAMVILAQVIEQHVIGVALLISESITDQSLHPAIVKGQRRVKGQLVPQALAQQAQLPQALVFEYLRVMRIAVHPSLQNQGLGSQLLQATSDYAKSNYVKSNQTKDNQFDFVATSYAASPAVVNFWHRNGFTPVKLGFNRDASSGEHSLMMLKATSSAGQLSAFIELASREFYSAFASWLGDEFSALSYQLVTQLLAMAPSHTAESVSVRDWEKINAFKGNVNLYRLARPSLTIWLQAKLVSLGVQLSASCEVKEKQERHAIASSVQAQLDALKPLVAKCLMLHQDAQVCQRFGFTGKKALYQHLQQVIQ